MTSRVCKSRESRSRYTRDQRVGLGLEIRDFVESQIPGTGPWTKSWNSRLPGNSRFIFISYYCVFFFKLYCQAKVFSSGHVPGGISVCTINQSVWDLGETNSFTYFLSKRALSSVILLIKTIGGRNSYRIWPYAVMEFVLTELTRGVHTVVITEQPGSFTVDDGVLWRQACW